MQYTPVIEPADPRHVPGPRPRPWRTHKPPCSPWPAIGGPGLDELVAELAEQIRAVSTARNPKRLEMLLCLNHRARW